MVREFFRLDPKVLQAREPPNPVDELEVGCPIIAVQPDKEHVDDMRMGIECLGEHLFDKTVG